MTFGLFVANERHVRLAAVFMFITCLSSVYVSGQTREALEAIEETSKSLGGLGVNGLLAFICVFSMTVTVWTIWMYTKAISGLTAELKGRPCFYKVAEQEARKR